jgi:pimeloyl-ACP methyl ester carboxylesterase
MNGEAMKVSDQPIDVQLAQFRAAHPLAHCQHTEEIWRYRRVGRGKDAVLWLTGALGVAELAFQSLLAMGPQFTVIAPDYPSTPTLDAFCDGLIAILNQERIERAHVVGGSLGGMIAQHLIRRYPDRVLSLVLSHTAAPESSRLLVGAVRVLVGTLPKWPESLVRKLFSRRLRVGYTAAGSFWLQYFDAAVATQSCAELTSRVRLAAEFAAQRHYKPDDLRLWPGRVMVLDADDDPLMPNVNQVALRTLYPQAELHRFFQTGHSVAILDPEGYASVIRQFISAAA